MLYKNEKNSYVTILEYVNHSNIISYNTSNSNENGNITKWNFLRKLLLYIDIYIHL